MSKLKKIKSVRFTQISNVIFEDYRLSYKEIGIYCNMMKFPDDWEFSIRYLAECHQDRKTSVKSGIDKLLEYGYITREKYQSRKEKGYFTNYDYVIYEDPYDNPDFIPCPPKDTTNPPENPCIENQPTDDSGPLSDFQHSDEPSADFPPAEDPPTTNTVYTNTFYTNTFLTKNEEDEDNACARIDADSFRDKLKNTYMCAYFSRFDNPEAMMHLQQAFNAVMNAVEDIKDEKAVLAVNSCTEEAAGNLFMTIYNDMFSTELGPVKRSDIRDKHRYLVKYISSQMKSSYGKDPLLSWGISS